eukprot:CAMPEP_0114269344 /NCGR_PEP_ID=MMETSP0058-20121206/26563_1 /TAXON_ID=36894 /ORGANISM="Pyramimonas parkeae, CCMP726" /LENGTH=110 /DNA_ID=CAMNT_0001387825 /DNA_START=212 /DNA_END=544 /DNA_ORIENTATION=+
MTKAKGRMDGPFSQSDTISRHFVPASRRTQSSSSAKKAKWGGDKAVPSSTPRNLQKVAHLASSSWYCRTTCTNSPIFSRTLSAAALGYMLANASLKGSNTVSPLSRCASV